MDGISDKPRHDDPRIEGRRIRVSDILYSLSKDEPLEQLYFWEIQEYKVDAAVDYYQENREWYEQSDGDIYNVSMLDESVESWRENKDDYDYEPDFSS